MKITGLITEYNPFHKGHEYHIKKAKEVTGADYIIVVMSGDFVQRGTPACVQKHVRAHMALVSGADLVLELPVAYATGSAELFAQGAVSILHHLGVVDYICFGSECGTTEPLMEIARLLVDEPDWYRASLQEHLKNGLSYPAARAAAIPKYSELLSSPNNILGIEYCKALLRLNSHIQPVSIKRKGNLYHAEQLNENLPSATAIRKQLLHETYHASMNHSKATMDCNKVPTDYNQESISTFNIIEETPTLERQIPKDALTILSKEIDTSGIVTDNDFSQMLLYRLLSVASPQELTSYMDVSDELAARVFKYRTQFISFDQFANLLKTKELTRTRINRALLHILLDIKKGQPTAVYARILGFRKDAAPLLSLIKNLATIPFFSKTSTIFDLLDSDQQLLFKKSIDASLLYESILAQKKARSMIHEHSKAIITV